MRLLPALSFTLCLLLLGACEQGVDDRVVDSGVRLSEQALDQFTQKNNGIGKAGSSPIIRFGFDLRATPQEDAKQYLPFLAYLQRQTGYPFELRFMPANDDIVDALGRGEVQLAAIGATSYLKAREKYGVRILVRGRNSEGRAEYRSMIVVRPDSDIKRLQDLRGKRIAFGDINSTQGHLIPRIVFAEHGITLEQLAAYQFTGSHLNCAKAVMTAHADACGMQDTMARILAASGDIRILHASGYFPSSGIAINADVDAETGDRIQQALLDFDPVGRDRASLYHWERTEMPLGFVPASDADYQKLHGWLVRLGLMDLLLDRAGSGP